MNGETAKRTLDTLYNEVFGRGKADLMEGLMTTRMLSGLFAVMFAGMLAGCSSTPPREGSPVAVVEIVTLRLRDGVSHTQFLVANRRVESEHVARQPGFLSRQTARGDNGEWLVVVHWASLGAAEASMASFVSAPAAQGFMAVIDGSSLIMKRYTVEK